MKGTYSLQVKENYESIARWTTFNHKDKTAITLLQEVDFYLPTIHEGGVVEFSRDLISIGINLGATHWDVKREGQEYLIETVENAVSQKYLATIQYYQEKNYDKLITDLKKYNIPIPGLEDKIKIHDM